MKLAMRLPEKGRRTSADSDPREDETTEVIDLASRTAYPVVSQRKGRSDALGLAAGTGVAGCCSSAMREALRPHSVAAPSSATKPTPAARPSASERPLRWATTG